MTYRLDLHQIPGFLQMTKASLFSVFCYMTSPANDLNNDLLEISYLALMENEF